MDVRYYFEPVDFSKYSLSGPIKWNYTLGAVIEKSTSSYNPEKKDKIDIAIFGVPFDSRTKEKHSNAPNNIRKELYQLSRTNKRLKIVDFGNLRISKTTKENYRAVRDLVEYFTEQKIITLILGGSQDSTIGICNAFRNDPFFSLSVVDARFDIKSEKEAASANNFMSEVFRQNPDILQFNLIGYQSYFVPSEYFLKSKGMNQHLRLGLLREKMDYVEPVFRNSDVVSFDFSSLQSLETTESANFSANGLRSDEACQLSRYAGIANRVKVFGLFEVPPEATFQTASAKLAAQIIWYFIDGFTNRQTENLNNLENTAIYKVEVENVDHPIVFINDMKTGQWWIEVKSIQNGRHFFACSEEEYLQAKNNEIPELWLKYVQKTDELLK